MLLLLLLLLEVQYMVEDGKEHPGFACVHCQQAVAGAAA
jgi:hypothetical protein